MIRPFYTAAAIRFAIAISVARAAAVVALPMRSTDRFLIVGGRKELAGIGRNLGQRH